ncbi:MAG: hypothetical protein OET21_02935, partial [Desulfobacterales bacterium]|nr:hypothetical protein [Desulfobacterales bacterium]
PGVFSRVVLSAKLCKIMQNPTKSYFGDFTNPSESLLFLHLRLTPKTLSLAFHAGDRGSNPLGDAMQKKEGQLVSQLALFFLHCSIRMSLNSYEKHTSNSHRQAKLEISRNHHNFHLQLSFH